MKILRIVGNLYPAFYGGLEIHTHSMSRLQSMMNCNVTVLTCDYNPPLSNIHKKYNIITHKSLIRPFGNPISPSIFLDLLKLRNDFDIIHAHDALFFTTNLAAFVKKLHSPPLIITNHGLISQTAPVWLSNIYYSSIGRLTLESADKIICYNDIERKKVIDIGVSPKKVEVIPNGVDINIFKPKKERLRQDDKSHILWVGRYTTGKNIDILIESAKILIGQYPNISFILVGQGPLKKQIEYLAVKLKIFDKIEFVDAVKNDEMPEIYNSSDVFVLPSRDEGVPRTILEAMACGLPIVCTDLPQLSDLISGCGITIPIGDPISCANAISNIISNKSLAQKFGENSREKIVKNHSWDLTVKKTIELYEKVIDQ